jgi:hypothetical protein
MNGEFMKRPIQPLQMRERRYDTGDDVFIGSKQYRVTQLPHGGCRFYGTHSPRLQEGTQAMSEDPVTFEINWSLEPSNERERLLRQAVIRRTEMRYDGSIFDGCHWMIEMALSSLAPDAAEIGDDLRIAIVRHRALRLADSEAKRKIENARLLSLAVADAGYA